MLFVHYFAWFENTQFSIWIREEWWVFPLILVVHSLGMGLMAGIGAASGLRVLGVARGVPMPLLRHFVPLLWCGFLASLLSGLLLLAAYPAKGLTNPLFYAKLTLLSAAMWLTLHVLRMHLSVGQYATNTSPPIPLATALAVMSLLLWAGVIAGGGFLAYTHDVLLASWLVSL